VRDKSFNNFQAERAFRQMTKNKQEILAKRQELRTRWIINLLYSGVIPKTFLYII
jgi:hypothetical protein